MPSNPSDPAAPSTPSASPHTQGLGLWRRWGFTSAGWRDNRHGEWWLAAQLLLIAALLLPPWPGPAALGMAWPPALRLLGAILVLVALAGALQALLRLGSSLTPLPEPMPGSALVTEGPYAACRHPLYRQILLGALGMTLLLGSLLHLLLLLALAGVLGAKARREERALLRLHPSAYAAYRAVTPAIVPLLPWLDWR